VAIICPLALTCGRLAAYSRAGSIAWSQQIPHHFFSVMERLGGYRQGKTGMKINKIIMLEIIGAREKML
jgi:hypothetical protein